MHALAGKSFFDKIIFHEARRTTSTMRAIATAIGSYQVDWDHYPLALEERDFSLEIFENPTYDYYLGPVVDAWGTPLRYISDGATYRLMSYGEDRSEGNSGGAYDADIVYQDGTLLP